MNYDYHARKDYFRLLSAGKGNGGEKGRKESGYARRPPGYYYVYKMGDKGIAGAVNNSLGYSCA